jgi:4-hydroxy-tetrahydrodipicolinate synthase
MTDLRLTGVVVATVLPFTRSGSIDETGFRRLLDYCATPDGVSSVFVNGHAGEGGALTPAERVRVIELAHGHLGDAKPLLAGVIPNSTVEAVEQARDARYAGADVAVLFPPPQFAAGGTRTADAPLAYVKAVLDGADMPASIFQYPISSGLGYGTGTLVDMARLPGVLAIKEGSDSLSAYAENWNRIKTAAPEVSVLASNFDWFLAQCAVGADGILSGLASLTPHFLVDLWRATEARDLDTMRAADARLRPIVAAIYGAPPRMDMHTRIKEALRHLGIIDCAIPRAPLLPVSNGVAAGIVRAVDEAGLGEFRAAS